ncbi:hypothetical protein CR513_42791, partial [Mucuna pruriens]
MQSITYGIILTYGDCAMIKSRAGVFWNPRSSRFSTFVTQRRKEAITNQCGQPRKSLTVGYTSPPYSETRTNSSRFGMSKVLISDQGSHFCNHAMATLLEKYGVVYQVAIAYHPQTNSQEEVFNREIKKLLQKMANLSRNDWAASWRMLCGCIEQIIGLH